MWGKIASKIIYEKQTLWSGCVAASLSVTLMCLYAMLGYSNATYEQFVSLYVGFLRAKLALDMYLQGWQ